MAGHIICLVFTRLEGTDGTVQFDAQAFYMPKGGPIKY